jgi:hypothetical protein
MTNHPPELQQEYTTYTADHEILMSFNDDVDAYYFETWWNTVGESQFMDYLGLAKG